VREELGFLTVRLEHIYLSPGHNFFGHHGKPPGEHPTEEVEQAECVTGQGLVGDRFFGFKENYKGQVTFFSQEVYEALCRELQIFDKTPEVFRRNFIVSGADLNALAGKRFRLQEVEFEGVEECRPCEWMDLAFGPGAEERLKGRGGLRARVMSDGVLVAEKHPMNA
jgi:MOSC domain-containing protein YiiM